MPLSVTNCSVTNTSITISFSDPVFTAAEVSASPAQWNSNASSALNPANYSIFDPGSAHFTTPRAIDTSIASPTLTSDRSITISFVSSGSGADEVQPGDWIH